MTSTSQEWLHVFPEWWTKCSLDLYCIIKLWVSTGWERLSHFLWNIAIHEDTERFKACVELCNINKNGNKYWLGLAWKICQRFDNCCRCGRNFNTLRDDCPLFTSVLCVCLSPDSVSKVRCQVVWFLHMDNMTDWWMVVTSSGLLLSLAYLHRDCRPGCTPFIQLSSVKHNPGSYITSSVGLNTKSCYFLDALQWGRGWSKVAENSLRKGQEVLQENEK